MQEEIIDIKGMHCKSCEKLIESRLKSLKGVTDIKVSFAEEKAHIRFDPSLVDMETIKSEIVKMGYKCEDDGSLKSFSKINGIIYNNLEKDYITIDFSKLVFWRNKKELYAGIIYGVVPHLGCIAYILFAILGVTAATAFFKPLLLNPYVFYIFIALSLLFATISAIIYLKKNEILSLSGIKRKWKYLTVLYGTTVFINLLLFMVIFPIVAANLYSGSAITETETAVGTPQSVPTTIKRDTTRQTAIAVKSAQSSIVLSVAIPCPGMRL